MDEDFELEFYWKKNFPIVQNFSFPGSPLHFAILVIQKNKKYFSYFLFY